jgi:hypothetical protein
MTEWQELDSVPGLIEPIAQYDLATVQDLVKEYCARFQYNPYQSALAQIRSSINLSIPDLEQVPQPAWDQQGPLAPYIGLLADREWEYAKYNLTNRDFRNLSPELEGTLISEISKDIQARYPKLVLGRIFLQSYRPMTTDPVGRSLNCVYQIHMPLWTTPATWLTAPIGLSTLAVHLPADGRIWQRTVNEPHSSQIGGTQGRIHLVWNLLRPL